MVCHWPLWFFGVGVSDARKDFSKYCDVLCTGLLLFASEVFGEGTDQGFQQDNGTHHNSNFTEKWLSEHSIKTLPWPPTSLDLPIIENV